MGLGCAPLLVAAALVERPDPAGFSTQTWWLLLYGGLAPLGLFRFSYGLPLNDESGDRTERFQFSIGSAF
jgi:outer membrane protein assembly factor BamA